MKRAAILLFCCTLTLSASSQNLWQRIVKWVQSSSTVDTTYLYKRPVAFSVNTNLSAKNVTSTMTSYQTLYEASNDGLGDSAWVPSIATTNLNGNLKTGIGLGIGYGKLSAGYSLNLAKKDKRSSLTFNLDYRGHSWGIGLNLFLMAYPATRTVVIDEEGSRWFHETSMMSQSECTVYRLVFDGYYSFNRKHFAHMAAYKNNIEQRRSAGSVILAANSLLSGMLCDTTDELFNSTGIKGFLFSQFSLGVGYSYNFVFFHQNPTGPKNEGLRNLTLNACVLPMITVSNWMQLLPTSGNDKITLRCPISPNARGQLALGYSYNQFFFSLQLFHNLYFQRSKDKISAEELRMPGDHLRDLTFNVLLQDWCLTGKFVYNF